MGASGKRSLDILIVDDDPVDRQLLARAFADADTDIGVHFCESASSALQQLRKSNGSERRSLPDACLFDINMPGLSGLELLEEIKRDAELRTIPVVMLSSSDDEKDVARSYELQASGYVCKPDSYPRLREIVGRIVKFWNMSERCRRN